MTNVETVIQTIDTLSSDELEQIYQYIRQRRQLTTWAVSESNIHELHTVVHDIHLEAQQFTDDEIDKLIDDTLDEVRRERKNN